MVESGGFLGRPARAKQILQQPQEAHAKTLFCCFSQKNSRWGQPVMNPFAEKTDFLDNL